jgi:hypothetical protein
VNTSTSNEVMKPRCTVAFGPGGGRCDQGGPRRDTDRNVLAVTTRPCGMHLSPQGGGVPSSFRSVLRHEGESVRGGRPQWPGGRSPPRERPLQRIFISLTLVSAVVNFPYRMHCMNRQLT